MKKILFLGIILSMSFPLSAKVHFGIDYVTEGHYGFQTTKGAWVSDLAAECNVDLWKGAYFRIKGVSTYCTDQTVVPSRLNYSDAAVENNWFRLFEFGIKHDMEKFSYFVGLGHINRVFFTTKASSAFTHSANGIFPTVSENFGVGDFPYSSLEFIGEYRFTDHWKLAFGADSQDVGDNIKTWFSFKTPPAFFSLATWEKDREDEWAGNAHAGFIIDSRTALTSFFAYADYPLFSKVNAIGQFGITNKNAPVNTYCGLGVVSHDAFAAGHLFGLMVNYAGFNDNTSEMDYELSYSVPFLKILELRASFHFINQGEDWLTAALLRLTVSFWH